MCTTFDFTLSTSPQIPNQQHPESYIAFRTTPLRCFNNNLQSDSQTCMYALPFSFFLFPVLPTNSQQTLLYGVPLGLREAAAFGQAVNCVEQGVDQRRERLRPRKQWSTFSQERQHSCTQIPVEGECHVCGTQSNLTYTETEEEMTHRV